MPISTDIIPNSPLSGLEFKKVILKRLEQTLDADGLFSAFVAFNQASWKIVLEVHMDNPTHPVHTVHVREGEIPLGTVGEIVAGLEITDKFTSANTTRVENDLPIPHTIRVGMELKHLEFLQSKEGLPNPNDPPQVVDVSDQLAKGGKSNARSVWQPASVGADRGGTGEGELAQGAGVGSVVSGEPGGPEAPPERKAHKH